MLISLFICNKINVPFTAGSSAVLRCVREACDAETSPNKKQEMSK